MRKLHCIVAAALLSIAGMGATAQDRAEKPPIRVFDAGELTLQQYRVIKRIWSGTWHSAFWVSSHDDAAAAIAAVTSLAAGAGADGVVNLHCLKEPGFWSSGYFCNGLAIKLN
jgi:hypothetical protein